MEVNYNSQKKAAERVAIAKDALAWVEAGTLIPTKGTYVSPEHYPNDVVDAGKQLRDVFLGKCEVCVKGALLLAKAVRFDNVLAVEMSRGREQALREHFSDEQITMVEDYFESAQWQLYGGTLANGSPEGRMVAILQNIIDNEGTFCPEKLDG